jgi:hypothetical protein
MPQSTQSNDLKVLSNRLVELVAEAAKLEAQIEAMKTEVATGVIDDRNLLKGADLVAPPTRTLQ